MPCGESALQGTFPYRFVYHDTSLSYAQKIPQILPSSIVDIDRDWSKRVRRNFKKEILEIHPRLPTNYRSMYNDGTNVRETSSRRITGTPPMRPRRPEEELVRAPSCQVRPNVQCMDPACEMCIHGQGWTATMKGRANLLFVCSWITLICGTAHA